MPLTIVRNNLVEMQTDAIVNTASPHPKYGTGLDTAVYKAAGEDKLLAARKEIGEIARGDIAVTPGFDLPAKYIIHAVGCWWDGGNNGEEEILRNCYRKALAKAEELGCESVALPLISAGNYGFPKRLVMDCAMEEIRSFLDGQEEEMDVTLVVFDKESFSISEELAQDVQAYIDQHKVDALKDMEYAGNAPGTATAPQVSLRRRREEEDLSDEMPPDLDAAYSAGIQEKSVSESRKMAAPVGRSIDISEKDLPDFHEAVGLSFREKLFELIDESGMTDVEVYKGANIDKKAFSKIKSGVTKNPGKKMVLALAVSLKLDLPTTVEFLSYAGHALSPNNVGDLVVQYFIEKGYYDIDKINGALYGYDQELLGSRLI